MKIKTTSIVKCISSTYEKEERFYINNAIHKIESFNNLSEIINNENIKPVSRRTDLYVYSVNKNIKILIKIKDDKEAEIVDILYIE